MVISMPSLEKCMFRFSAHFLIGFVFLFLSYMSYLYILEMNSLSETLFANIFTQSVSCLFALFYVWRFFFFCGGSGEGLLYKSF